MRIRTKLTSGLLAVATASLAASVEPVPATETPAQREARLQWWREARFGLFIHWGPVSLKGTEIGWSRGGERRGYGSTGTQIPAEVYDNLYTQFNPTNFNAREWVAMAKAAGMKYLVFTSRHHDGFSMFDTTAGDYKITNPGSPFRRDVVKELADACHEAGLPFGLYYSQPNWFHPDAFTPDRHDRYLAYLKQQVTELCSNYGRLDIFWFDGLGKSAKDYDGEELVKIIRRLQPHIIINNRTGLPEDHDTPEQRVGKYQDGRPWESCITICHQWAWKPEDEMKSLKECLQTLIRCAGGDGNLLFNVGPMPDGRIEPRQVERLREMGAWLAKYGETIYGTRGGPFKPGKWGASTRKDETVYLHVFNWPTNVFMLPPLNMKLVSGTVVTGGQADVRQTAEGITIKVAPANRQPISTILALKFDGSVMNVPAVSLGGGSLSEGAKATASNVFERDPHYAASAAVDGDDETRWATDGGTRQAWLEVDLGKVQTFSRVRIDEWAGGGKRIQSFELQLRADDAWKTIHRGKTIGPSWELNITPVAARQIRLNILDATNGPTINEFQLFPN
jgi:alpha-L-fucosidase